MVSLLGFDIFDGKKEEFINKIIADYKSGKRMVIISGNPEVLYNSLKNTDIMCMRKECDIIPDGVGVLIAGRITRQPFKEKIAGIEVVEELLRLSKKQNMKIYMLGAEDWVVNKAAKTCVSRYNALIAGFHNGFFDMNNCDNIIEDINDSSAELLLIAMGSPRQERFISRYKDKLCCKVFMGVGGSFDVLAGKINRAPSWMVNMGIEWLYRVIKEPYRVKRLFVIPKFLLKVVLDNKGRSDS